MPAYFFKSKEIMSIFKLAQFISDVHNVNNTAWLSVLRTLLLSGFYIFFLQGCNTNGRQSNVTQDSIPLLSIPDSLPAPYETKSVKNYSKVIGWPENKTPVAPSGFTVTKFAEGLQNPRWIYVTSNGDILV